MNLSHWEYTGPDFNLDDALGFIYCITNKEDGRRYFGRKQFWNKRGRHWIESDWEDYRGSSTWLGESISELGEGAFRYEIISVFRTKTGMSLGESIAIVCTGCLEEPDKYYNRAAPSIRGKLKITSEDAESLKRLREWINENL